MKDKPSEWISISDLMAGIMAVIMLLLIMSELKQQAMKYKLQYERKQKVMQVFEVMNTKLQKLDIANLATFDTVSNKIIFKDAIFEKGSAKLTEPIKKAFSEVKYYIVDLLKKDSTVVISVDGHTDDDPVKSIVTDYNKYGAVYDDNYTLSAARAREARKILIGDLPKELSDRVIVAGYGSTRLLDKNNPLSAVNRRVEISINFK